jgi:hypothetical protein
VICPQLGHQFAREHRPLLFHFLPPVVGLIHFTATIMASRLIVCSNWLSVAQHAAWFKIDWVFITDYPSLFTAEAHDFARFELQH